MQSVLALKLITFAELELALLTVQFVNVNRHDMIVNPMTYHYYCVGEYVF